MDLHVIESLYKYLFYYWGQLFVIKMWASLQGIYC